MNRMRRSDPFSWGSERNFKRCSIEIDGNAASGALPGGMSISDAMETGLAHHHAGRLGPAETIYQRVLQVSPAPCTQPMRAAEAVYAAMRPNAPQPCRAALNARQLRADSTLHPAMGST